MEPRQMNEPDEVGDDEGGSASREQADEARETTTAQLELLREKNRQLEAALHSANRLLARWELEASGMELDEHKSKVDWL